MKKSRYEQKISLGQHLAMTLKSRYEKISLWTQHLAMKNIAMYKHLAMKESRYGQHISL